MAARVVTKFGAKAVCFQENSCLQVESAVATVDGSSEDLHKCATAINDLAYKVSGLSCALCPAVLSLQKLLCFICV